MILIFDNEGAENMINLEYERIKEFKSKGITNSLTKIYDEFQENPHQELFRYYIA